MTEKELKSNTSVSNLEVDFGLYHNWSTILFKGKCKIKMDGETYIEYLKFLYYRDKGDRDKELHILPIRRTVPSTSWKICWTSSRRLLYEQWMLSKFLNNNKDYKLFRGGVVGFGGTGKSFIINIPKTIVLKMT